MKTIFFSILCSLVAAGLAAFVYFQSGVAADSESSVPAAAGSEGVSGQLVGGYRVLSIAPGGQEVNFVVYRGDYIKFSFDASMGEPLLSMPALSVEQRLPADVQQAPYVKMKTSGRYAFTLGSVAGSIEVIDYQRPNYSEVTARQADEFIASAQPLVLDVRTTAEFKQGHLKDARLIPVQELQKRIGELAAYKDKDILIYCATGNRSTVASKILIDRGFTRIVNMRHGIAQWYTDKLPVVAP
jgi:rhodanese-related sulfurtransferase